MTAQLDAARWLAPVDDADETVLGRCRGPVLDVGCGPGRFVSSLSARGIAALGVDVAETAVALTRGHGLPALRRSVFARVPGEGRWPTILLLDGNIGIGGDPARLLGRVRTLLAPGGRLLVEAHRDPCANELVDVQVGECATPFAWAHVGRAALLGYAESVGYAVGELWSSSGRDFAALAR